MKKITAVLAALVMIFSAALPVGSRFTAFAADEFDAEIDPSEGGDETVTAKTSGEWTYEYSTIDGGTPFTVLQDGDDFVRVYNSVTLTEYSGSAAKITLPETVDGLTVVSLGGSLFSDNDTVTEITLPKSVRTVDFSAVFCPNLSAVNVTSGNTSFSSKDGVLFSEDGSVLILFPSAKSGSCTVPGGTKTIAWGAFGYVPNLTELTLSDTVTTLEDYSLSGLDSVETLTVPETVTEIGDGALQAQNLLCKSGSAAETYAKTRGNGYTFLESRDGWEVYILEGDDADYVHGDVNGDGELNIKDVIMLLQLINIGSDDPAADFNDDYEVNIKDAVLMLQTINGAK